MSQEINLVINFNEKTGKYSYEMATDETFCLPSMEIQPGGLQPLISCSTCSDNWSFKIYLSTPKISPQEPPPPPPKQTRRKQSIKHEERVEEVKLEQAMLVKEEVEEETSPEHVIAKQPTSTLIKPAAGNFGHSSEIRSILRRVKRQYNHESFHHKTQLADGTDLFVTRVNDGGNVYASNFDMRPLKCDICHQRQIKDLTSFLRHRKLHFVEAGDTSCNACKVEFRNHNEVTIHTLICPNKGQILPLHCKFCNFGKFDSYKNQRLHEKFHVRGRPKWAEKKREQKMCDKCPKLCSNQEQLKFHLRKFHEIDPYLCAHCPKKFGQRNLIRVHLIQAHFKQLAGFKCELCSKVFCLNKGLESHRNKTHNDIKEACSLCGKLIKSLHMQQHIERQHTSAVNRRKWPCFSCGKTFLTKAHADSHEISHLPQEQWQWKCKYCEKRYPDKHNLSTHERIHLKGPEHTCSHCSKSFTTKQYLADHVNLHTGLKPYECRVCKKKFSDRGNLRFHLKNHEKQMGVKLTMTIDERRIMKQQGAIDTNMFMQ